MRRFTLVLATLAVLAPAAASTAQSPTQSAPAGAQCFRTRDWSGWRAPDTTKMYIRVGRHEIYKVDFSSPCTGLTDPLARVVSQSTTGTVCSPLDLDLTVTNTGFSNSCIASKITPLTTTEMAALPKSLTP